MIHGWVAAFRAREVRMIEQDPPVKQNGNSITIGHIDDRELRRNVSISYEVTVPSRHGCIPKQEAATCASKT